jgi:hypothetical protein
MSEAAAAPKHLWIIGIISLLWNMMGAFDYLMTQTENESYMAKFDPAQLDYFYNFPTWVVVFWALAVWGSVIGSVLLLLRKRLAVQVFMVSFISMVITSIYNFVLSNGMEVMGSTGFVFTVVIFFVALGLWLYARAMHLRGVLS